MNADIPPLKVWIENKNLIGNNPSAATKEYVTLDTIWSAEDCNRWSVANSDKIYY
jgi:hypothetical protein